MASLAETKETSTNFLSLPPEIRDEVLSYLLVDSEPIGFDDEIDFMPTDQMVRWGLILMSPSHTNRSFAAMARSIFYGRNTFRIQYDDINSFFNPMPFPGTESDGFPVRQIGQRLIITFDQLEEDETLDDVDLVDQLGRYPNLTHIHILVIGRSNIQLGELELERGKGETHWQTVSDWGMPRAYQSQIVDCGESGGIFGH